jgi:hypothetical protein
VKRMRRTLAILAAFSIAMACVEAAVVVYLRELYYPGDILSIFPARFLAELDFLVELTREAATVVMLLAVALLTVRAPVTRTFAAFVYLFGLWDIFYYVWLKIMIGWPVAWLEWDVLFLIPWVWLGPWICPVLIALLFVVWGAWCLQSDRSPAFSRASLSLFVLGASLDLITFLQPALPVLRESGMEGMRHFTPTTFWWGLFLPGYLLMAAGLYKTLPNHRTPAEAGGGRS